MGKATKITLILGLLIAIAGGIWVYLSPYYSCLREGWDAAYCARR
jgi:hypothetical protein